MELQRIRRRYRGLSKAEREKEIAALPVLFGGNMYKIDSSHIAICHCCSALKEFRDQERLASARYRYNKSSSTTMELQRKVNSPS